MSQEQAGVGSETHFIKPLKAQQYPGCPNKLLILECHDRKKETAILMTLTRVSSVFNFQGGHDQGTSMHLM